MANVQYQGPWQLNYYQGAWGVQTPPPRPGPANIIGVYPASVVAFTRFNKWTRVSVGWVSLVHVEIGAFEYDYYKSMGNFSTLASRISVLRGSDGNWSPGAFTHGAFTFSANSHHTALHATSHLVGGSQPFARVSAGGGYGFFTQTLYSKLASVATSSTDNRMTAIVYTGNGAAGSQVITVGFRAMRAFIQVDDDSTVHRSFRKIMATTPTGNQGIAAIAEIASAATAHRTSDSWVRLATNVLRVKGIANLSAVVYRGVIWGQNNLQIRP